MTVEQPVNLAEAFARFDEVFSPMFVVPKGVEHCPRADRETHVLLIEPRDTPNTGDAGGPRTSFGTEL